MAVVGISKKDKKAAPSKLETASKLLGALNAAGSIFGQVQDYTDKNPAEAVDGEEINKKFRKTGDFGGPTLVKKKTGIA